MPDIDDAIKSYCEMLTRQDAARFARDYPKSMVPTVEADPNGQKYTRIVRRDSVSRSVVCFIERATGKLWAADGWKRPRLNFPRGNVYEVVTEEEARSCR